MTRVFSNAVLSEWVIPASRVFYNKSANAIPCVGYSCLGCDVRVWVTPASSDV